MHIRRSTLTDCPAIARLHRETVRAINSRDYPSEVIKAWAGTGKISSQRCEETHKTHIRCVAIEGKIIIGFCDMRKDGKFGGLYVHKDFIRKGVGSKLLGRIEQIARKRGVRKFTVWSSITAKPFYQKQGYTVLKKTKFILRRSKIPMKAFVMEKYL